MISLFNVLYHWILMSCFNIVFKLHHLDKTFKASCHFNKDWFYSTVKQACQVLNMSSTTGVWVQIKLWFWFWVQDTEGSALSRKCSTREEPRTQPETGLPQPAGTLDIHWHWTKACRYIGHTLTWGVATLWHSLYLCFTTMCEELDYFEHPGSFWMHTMKCC